MFHCKDASLGLPHLTHFTRDSCARSSLKFSIFLMSLFSSDISKESFDHCLNWSWWSIGCAEARIFIERILWLPRLEISSGVLQACIDLLSKVVLLITGCSVIFNCESIKFLKVLIGLLLKSLLMRGPIRQHYNAYKFRLYYMHRRLPCRVCTCSHRSDHVEGATLLRALTCRHHPWWEGNCLCYSWEASLNNNCLFEIIYYMKFIKSLFDSCLPHYIAN